MSKNKQLLILILNKEEYLEEILALFLELGISGATIIDSMGMGRIVTHDIPIFAGFRDLMAGNRPYNKTILSVIDEDVIPEVMCGIKQVCANVSEQGIGLLFTVPVNNFFRLSGD